MNKLAQFFLVPLHFHLGRLQPNTLIVTLGTPVEHFNEIRPDVVWFFKALLK